MTREKKTNNLIHTHSLHATTLFAVRPRQMSQQQEFIHKNVCAMRNNYNFFLLSNVINDRPTGRRLETERQQRRRRKRRRRTFDVRACFTFAVHSHSQSLMPILNKLCGEYLAFARVCVCLLCSCFRWMQVVSKNDWISRCILLES